MNKITITPLKKGIPIPKRNKKKKNVNLYLEEPYAKLPLIIQAVSKRASGKSYSVSEMLKDEKLIGRNRFENIYYFNPNHFTDPSWGKLKLRTKKQLVGYDEDDKPMYEYIPYDYHFTKMDYDIINEILEEQTELLGEIGDEDKLPQILIIVDDIVLNPLDMDKEENPISRIIRNGRHYGISLIYSIQRMKQLVSTVLRDNTDILIFWVNSNSNMLESIYEYYFKGFILKEGFDRLISKLRIAKQHNFLLLNMKDQYNLYSHIDGLGFGLVDIPKELKERNSKK